MLRAKPAAGTAQNGMGDVDPLSFEVLVAIFLLLYVPIAYYYVWLLPPSVGIDYPTYYQAARATFVEGRSPYGLGAFRGLPGFGIETVQPYLSAPPSLLVYWPLAKLSPASARALFLIVGQLCYIASIWIILFRLTPAIRNEPLQRLSLILSLVYLLSFDPAFSTLGTGDQSFLVLFLVCLTLAALRQRTSDWRIALPLSIAILMKTYPALLLLPLLFRRRYRAFSLTVIFLGASTALSFLALPQGTWQSWWSEMLPLTGYINTRLPLAIAWNQSLNAFVMRLFQENYFSKAPVFLPFITRPAIIALVLLSLGTTCVVAARRARLGYTELSRDSEAAAFVCLSFLLPPLAWDHHLVYVLPVVNLVIAMIVTGAVSRSLAVILFAALFAMAWKLPLGSKEITQGWWTLLISAKLYPVIILWAFFVTRLFRQPSVRLSPSGEAA